MVIDSRLLEILACPYDGERLSAAASGLTCSRGHGYRVVDGIPILLRDDVPQTHWAALRALELPEAELVEGSGKTTDNGVHSFVQTAIGGTNGIMYGPLIGNLREYPIPILDANPTSGVRFLDVGCNWGRWCVAASRAGFEPVGVDPSFEAVHAARDVTAQLGVPALFVVADARYLPFVNASFDFVFSYSVLQHLSEGHVRESLDSIRRILGPGGRSMIQMPNRMGVRSLQQQARRGFRPAQAFEVRYWSVGKLEEVFSTLLGSTTIEVDGFLSLNAQISDRDLLPLKFRAIVSVSERLKRLSRTLPVLRHVADSLYVISVKAPSLS